MAIEAADAAQTFGGVAVTQVTAQRIAGVGGIGDDLTRAQAFGKRLNIPATTALRFEPGDEKEVVLVPFQGKQRIIGFNSLVDGWVGDENYNDYRPRLADAMERVARYGFKNKP